MCKIILTPCKTQSCWYNLHKLRRFRFGGVLVTATYGHYDQHAAKIGLGCICWIWLPASDSVPFFQRRPGSDCEKPARIRSGHILAKIFWSGRKSVCKNYRAKLWQNATGFSIWNSVAFFHRRPRSYCAKKARIRFVCGWLCQVLVKRIRSGSLLVCNNYSACFWQRFRAGWVWMRIGSWVVFEAEE